MKETKKNKKNRLQVVLGFLPLALVTATSWQHAIAHEEVHQSQSVNGKTTSISSTGNTATIHLGHESIKLTEHKDSFTLHYCANKCHSYLLNENGTVIKQ